MAALHIPNMAKYDNSLSSVMRFNSRDCVYGQSCTQLSLAYASLEY